MSGWLLASYVVLWALVISILIVLLVVLRQLGLIYMRDDSVSARGDGGMGPEVGSRITTFPEVDDRTDTPFTVPSDRHDRTFVLFVSPDCEVCEDAVAAIDSVHRPDPVCFVVLSAGEPNATRRFGERLPESVHFATHPGRIDEMGVDLIPFGILVDADGVVQARGPVSRPRDVDRLMGGVPITPNPPVPETATRG